MVQSQHSILIFHGSSSLESQKTTNKFIESIKNQSKLSFSVCYLKESSPTLSDALTNALNEGKTEITCFPLFLLPGSHVLKDIPKIVEDFKHEHPECNIKLLPCLAEKASFVDYTIKVLENNK